MHKAQLNEINTAGIWIGLITHTTVIDEPATIPAVRIIISMELFICYVSKTLFLSVVPINSTKIKTGKIFCCL